MKKLKKLITILILIVILGNFIFPNYVVFAEDKADAEVEEKSDTEAEEKFERDPNIKPEKEPFAPSSTFFEDLILSGSFKHKQDQPSTLSTLGQNLILIIPNIFLGYGKLVAQVVEIMLNTFLKTIVADFPGTEPADFINSDRYKHKFTLDKLFFGDIRFIDANFFKVDAKANDINSRIKQNVAKWYVIMSGLALVLILGVMIYLAINMVLVYAGIKTPQKHADIKRTMTNLVVSTAMIFIMPIILSTISSLVDVITNLFTGARIGVINGLAENNIEIISRRANLFTGGFTRFIQDVTYIFLIVIYLRFMIVYLKRFFTLAFLTVISPLVAVTYSIDKLKDDKSQVLGKFYREYFYAYFLKLLHSFMYIIYFSGLGMVASVSPLAGLFLLSLYGRVEKIIKGAFDSRDLIVIRSSEEFLKGGG